MSNKITEFGFWNLFCNGSNQAARFAEIVKERGNAPEVLGLCEIIDDGQFEQIQKFGGYTYAEKFTSAWFYDHKQVEHLGFLSIHPVTNIKTYLLSQQPDGQRILVVATVQHPILGRLKLGITHLSHFGLFLRNWTTETRNLIKAVKAELEEEIPLFLTGDFNALTWMPPVKQVSRYLNRIPGGPTCRWGLGWSTIDFWFSSYTNDLELETVFSEGVSDHALILLHIRY